MKPVKGLIPLHLVLTFITVIKHLKVRTFRKGTVQFSFSYDWPNCSGRRILVACSPVTRNRPDHIEVGSRARRSSELTTPVDQSFSQPNDHVLGATDYGSTVQISGDFPGGKGYLLREIPTFVVPIPSPTGTAAKSPHCTFVSDSMNSEVSPMSQFLLLCWGIQYSCHVK
jgi:hypothetical protein